jgi:hypothetical protein
MCGDFLCEKCENVFRCEKCGNNSELYNGKCVCSEGFYFDHSGCSPCQVGCKKCDKISCFACEKGYYSDETCLKCSEYCSECNEKSCLSCIESFYLEQGSCYKECHSLCSICSFGKCLECEENSYLEVNTCIEIELNLNISVTYSNDLILLFSEDLNSDLIPSCLSVSTQNNSVDIKINPDSQKKFIISLNLKEKVSENQELILIFLCNITSSKNSKLSITEYTISLHSSTKENTVKTYEITRENYEKVTLATTSSLIGISLFNPNFSSLWSFLSSIQLISFLYLLNVPVSERTRGLLVGLRKYLIFPNIFYYLLDDDGISHQFSKLEDFKYRKNSFLVNSGTTLSMFLFGIALFVLMKIFEKILRSFSKTKLKKNLKEFFENYKYSFFIRFWIQNYAEIAVSAGLSLLTSDLNLLSQAYSFFISCIFSVFFK